MQSLSQLMISASAPGRPSGLVSRQWVKSDCQVPFGREAWNRM